MPKHYLDTALIARNANDLQGQVMEHREKDAVIMAIGLPLEDLKDQDGGRSESGHKDLM